MVFLGDDTWVGIYPNAFTYQFPFDSFDVGDLHTVDNGVLKNIFKFIEDD
jgi:phosphatidylinositol glycan class O